LEGLRNHTPEIKWVVIEEKVYNLDQTSMKEDTFKYKNVSFPEHPNYQNTENYQKFIEDLRILLERTATKQKIAVNDSGIFRHLNYFLKPFFRNYQKTRYRRRCVQGTRYWERYNKIMCKVVWLSRKCT
jgi:hypothetical protein